MSWWSILLFVGALWLFAPVPLLILLIVARHQLAAAREEAALWQQRANACERRTQLDSAEPDHPISARPVSTTWALPAQRAHAEPARLELSRPAVRSATPPQIWETHPPALQKAAHPLAKSDWQPATPSVLEQTLRTISGWSRFLAPFLVQNIGWFVGGFCFIAGALFLVTNTAGFSNALAVWGSLICVTAFLIWSGYQFRRERPELISTSRVLLSLGLMLGVLNLTVTVSLFNASGDILALQLISLMLGLITLSGFALIAWLVSALMDRALRGRYATLLSILAGLQLAAPLHQWLNAWQILALLHGILLLILAVALQRFTRQWLRQLFVDRSSTSLFSAGMLVYAALVSFFHLSWVWQTPLPVGYSGPFLMALCLLLFPVDAAVREWLHQYAFLSRFSFVLYGLSIIAIILSLPSTPAALLTLSSGAGLYAWMSWRYLTLPPLYLMLGCIAGLYGYTVLRGQTPDWYFISSIPALFALSAFAHWIAKRSAKIASQCGYICILFIIGLTGWSLVWSVPSNLGFFTATAAAAFIYALLRYLGRLENTELNRHFATASAILVLVFVALAIAYSPPWSALSWALQTAFGWLGLATVLTILCVHKRRTCTITVSVSGILLLISAALFLASYATDWSLLSSGYGLKLFAASSVLLFYLSLGLCNQPLFYGALLILGAMGVALKYAYFPEPGVGLGMFILVLLLWAWMRILQAYLICAEELAFTAVSAEESRSTALSISLMIYKPLQQTLLLLWIIGFCQAGLRLLTAPLAPALLYSGILATVSSALLVIHLQKLHWMALPMLLGLVSLLSALAYCAWSLSALAISAGLYALLLWGGAVLLLQQALPRQLASILGLTTGMGGRQQLESSLHYCALCIGITLLMLLPTLMLSSPNGLWIMLGVISLIFLLTGWRYRTAYHAWLFLITVVLGVTVYPNKAGALEDLLFDQPLTNAILSLGMALLAVALQKREQLLKKGARPDSQ